MKVNKVDLLNSLALVRPGLAKSDMLEQTDCFFFMRETIRTFNDEIQVVVNFPTGIEGAIHPQRFYTLLSKIPDEELLIIQKNDRIVIKGKSKKATFSLTEISPEVTNSLIDPKKIDKWKKLPKDFTESLKFCLLSALDKDKESVLSCLYVNGSEILSSDDLRVTVKTMEANSKLETLIPKESAKELIKYNPIKYNKGKSWINFKNEEGVIFSSRIVEGKFPDISKIIKIKDGIDIELPKKIIDVLNRTEIMSEDDLITLSLSEGKIICRGVCDYGEYEETSKIEYSGEEISIQVNPNFLKSIIAILNNLKLDNSRNKVVFKGKGFIHVMSIKVEK